MSTKNIKIMNLTSGFGKVHGLPHFDLVGKKIALMSAENYRYLRKKGITVRKTVDVIIGTFCIVNDFILLHSEKDYDPMEKQLGLKIYR